MSAPVRLHHDFETFSKVDLTKVGTSRYARHPSTDVLMCAYAFNDEPVQQWVYAEGERMPSDLRDAIRDPTVYKFAWNKPFEWNIWTHVLGIETPHKCWRDPMVLAYSLSFPGALERAGAIVELPFDKVKMADAKRLIRRFCKPRVPTPKKPWTRADFATDPEEWETFKEYNRQDVEAERAFWIRCRQWNLPRDEWDLWIHDQEINEAGIPINLDVVDNAIRLTRDLVTSRIDRMREITRLENPNSVEQLLPWLRGKGYPFDDLKKGHVKRALDASLNEVANWEKWTSSEYAEVLGLRLETSKSSVKKFNALALATDNDGLLRNAFQFAGAGRTWRWSGRKYQAQNLARPVRYLDSPEAQVTAVTFVEHADAWTLEQFYDYPMDVLSTCVRPVVQAPDGYVFVDADLNAIENRVLGWLADEQKILNVFRDNRDPYIDFGTYLFHQPYEHLWNEYKTDKIGWKRQLSKPAVLGAGYMLGPGAQFENEQTGEIQATGLLGYAWNMGVTDMTPELSERAVKTWRETYSGVVDYWREIERAAKRCIRSGEPTQARHIRFDRNGPFLRMILPKGRALHYCRPRIDSLKTPWGEMRPTITYENLDDRNQWVRIATHPGKVTENADQAIARDLLAHGMRLARLRGVDIRLHVHDQIVGLVREDKAERTLKILLDSMEEIPSWAPGLPLKANGHISKYFVKD